jgi:YtkA-like
MTTKRLTLLAFATAVLAVPTTATAGGWATVGLDPPPDGLAPGEAWSAQLTLLQHGRTPLEGRRPRVIVRRDGGGGRREFQARPTGEPGVYRASVVFASAGTWRYSVDDDFAATHSFAPVTIGKGETTQVAGLSDDDPDYLLALAAAAVAGLAAGLIAMGLRRRRA